MKTYVKPPVSKWAFICKRTEVNNDNLLSTVSTVFEKVKKDEDVALVAYTKEFDGVVLESIELGQGQIDKWADQVPTELKKAIDLAYQNIKKFHASQGSSLKSLVVETQSEVRCWREARAIDRVGLYIPGGSAPLFSTVLMLGVPAQLAGCREVALCTPPQTDGSVNPAICYAARLVGVTKLLKIGGIQAIAAMTLGTPTVPKVDKLFGPGNQYVTAAKMYAQRFGVAIDMPAGPSEVMVIADKSARVDFVAADLLSQAEHGPDSQVVLVTNEATFPDLVKEELANQLEALPRKGVAEQALANSFCVVVENLKEALDFANEYAPEHLILSVEQPEKYVEFIRNAGSVFLGNYTPESAGDYASGTNHTLPTNGWAKSCSGLSLESFYKYVTVQSVTEDGCRQLAPTVMAMADAEGLAAHKRAMEIRL